MLAFAVGAYSIIGLFRTRNTQLRSLRTDKHHPGSSENMALVDIVTGASQGIGSAVAESIAFQRSSQQHIRSGGYPSYALVLVGRNEARGAAVAERIQKLAGVPVKFESCDVSDFWETLALEERISDKFGDFRVGVLVNDAAECPKTQQFVQRKRQSSTESSCSVVDVDKQFATNVLGYHFMIKVFQDHFTLDGSKTHVVNIASNWAGSLDLNDLQFTRRRYDSDTAYRQSKQCNRMLTKAWSRRLHDKAVVNSCHPGDPRTTLSVSLGYNMWSSPPSRSMMENETPIPFLCGFDLNKIKDASDAYEMTTGGWFEGRTRVPSRCQFARLETETEQLFEICESYCLN